ETWLANPGSYRRFASMADAHAQYGSCAHVMSNMPDAATWRWLSDHQLSWVAAARANRRVWYRDNKRNLKQCRVLGETMPSAMVWHRGRLVRAGLRRLPV